MVRHIEVEITDKVIKEHGLTPPEYSRIKKILKREPNIVELGMYSVLWSEHCSYKSSKPLLKKFPTKSARVLQGPGENAGVIDIGDGLAISMKIESHNHPSAIEPYQGAATGVGGIVRDVFTMGAKPIASLNSLRFGPLSQFHNRFLFDGVVAGIAGYGNCLGLPTVAGEVYFEDCYTGNCLVNAMAVGLLHNVKIPNPKSKNKYRNKDKKNWYVDEYGPGLVKGYASGAGNPVLYVGSSTGRDGIHGATFASVELSEESEEKKSSVQVGDPFTEKSLIEACLELVRSGVVVGMQDMGAAGLTSSTSEMASRAGMGIEIDLAKVPQREENMTAYDIMLSESQERMVVVVKKGTEKKAIKIFEKWGLHAVVMGRVTKDKMLKVKINEQVVAEVPAVSLADDAPVYQRASVRPKYLDKVQPLNIDRIPKPKDYSSVLLKLLSSANIASKAWVYEQYDHMVQLNTEVLPGRADAAVLRVKGQACLPARQGSGVKGKIEKTNKHIALTCDGNSRYCYLNPEQGGAIAVAEASRNLVCTGATPIALTNCLNFGNPEKPEIFYQFKKVIDGMIAACEKFEIPVISGNVSLYNESKETAIYPTPVIGMLGLINSTDYTTMGFKYEEDVIVLLGAIRSGFDGSEYLKVIHNKIKGNPEINLDFEKRVQKTCLNAIQKGIIHSCHDLSEGGLAVAIAESLIFAEKDIKGVSISLCSNLREDAVLFGENQSRILLSLSAEDLFLFDTTAKIFDVPYEIIGKVKGEGFHFNIKGTELFNLPRYALEEAYFKAIPKLMQGA